MSPFSRGWPEGSLFNSYYTEVSGRALLLSLDCSTLPLIRALYCWVLSKEVSSTIFKVFGMTWLWIEPRSPRPLANTLPTRPKFLNLGYSQFFTGSSVSRQLLRVRELSAIAFLLHASIIAKNKNIILYFLYSYVFLVVNNDTAEYTTLPLP